LTIIQRALVGPTVYGNCLGRKIARCKFANLT